MTSLITRPLSLFDAIEEIFRDISHFDSFSKDYQNTYQIPSYPVSNIKISHDGTTTFQIATTNFSKDEVNVLIENNILTVETGKDEKQEDPNQYKYLYRRIAERNFRVQYRLSSKMDVDKAAVSMENGVLTIVIPVKEGEKPVTKKLQIS